VLDELARREMTGIRFSPGFEREELNRFLEEFLRSGVTGTALLDACRASGEGHVVPVPSAAEDEFDESETELVGPDGTEAPVGEGIEDPGVARRRAQRRSQRRSRSRTRRNA